MIKWEELTSIDLIPKDGSPVLVCLRILQLCEIIVFNTDHPDENSYVIYLDGREWFSGEEILDRYSHFCLIDQPERSKREKLIDKDEGCPEWANCQTLTYSMRCSEHCRNTVREAQ